MIDTSPTHTANVLDAAYSEQALQQAQRSTWRRWLFLLLALLGVNGFLWIDLHSAQPLLSNSTDAGVQAAIAPNKIMPQPGKAPAAFVEQAPPPPVLEPLTAADTIAPPEKTACMLWEFPSNADLKRANTRLTEHGWGGYGSELALEPTSYMVFTGPFDDDKALNAKLKVIEKMKLQDYRTLPTGVISLGVLSTPEAAKALMQTLTKRGLLAVDTMERPNRVQRTRYRFEGLTPSSLKALTTLSTKGTSLGTVRACP